MAILIHSASTTVFCCKNNATSKKYIRKSEQPLVVQGSLYGVGGQGNHNSKFNPQWQTSYFN